MEQRNGLVQLHCGECSNITVHTVSPTGTEYQCNRCGTWRRSMWKETAVV